MDKVSENSDISDSNLKSCPKIVEQTEKDVNSEPLLIKDLVRNESSPNKP